MLNFYIIQLSVVIVALLCSVAANAYDFEVEGIYYSITSYSDFTVEVVSGDKKHSGEIVIPSSVTYKSKTVFANAFISTICVLNGRKVTT